MTQREIISGDEIKLGARYKAEPEGDIADRFIVIKSLDTLLDEEVTEFGTHTISGEPMSAADYKAHWIKKDMPKAIETIDEWLLIARQRYIDHHASADMKDALHFRVAWHAYTVAFENDFERLKGRAFESLGRVLGAGTAEKFIKTFFGQPKAIRDHPSHKEIFRAGEKGKIISEVSRDGEGRIIYVVPGSTKWIVAS